MNLRMLATASLLGMALATAAQADTFSRNYEAPGVQNTTAGFSTVGVETFDEQSLGTQSWSTDFGTSGAITGNFTSFPIVNANLYGGAGGTGHYAQLFSSNTSTLTLDQGGHGVTYLGFWLSALSPGNTVTFYDNSTVVASYDASTVFNGLTPSQLTHYLGNPTSNFLGQDGGEPFAFVNFYDTTGTFNKVVFTQTAGGGFEFDNVTVGTYTSMGGVPEPGTWAMMLLGLGALGATLRAHRRADRKLQALEAGVA